MKIGKFEISKELGFVDRKEFFDGFVFYHHRFLDHHIDSKAQIDTHFFVFYRYVHKECGTLVIKVTYTIFLAYNGGRWQVCKVIDYLLPHTILWGVIDVLPMYSLLGRHASSRSTYKDFNSCLYLSWSPIQYQTTVSFSLTARAR